MAHGMKQPARRSFEKLVREGKQLLAKHTGYDMTANEFVTEVMRIWNPTADPKDPHDPFTTTVNRCYVAGVCAGYRMGMAEARKRQERKRKHGVIDD